MTPIDQQLPLRYVVVVETGALTLERALRLWEEEQAATGASIETERLAFAQGVLSR